MFNVNTVYVVEGIPYEIVTYTSDSSGAGTEADVYIVLYGENAICTTKTSLCPNKNDRKKHFKTGAIGKFVVEVCDFDLICYISLRVA